MSVFHVKSPRKKHEENSVRGVDEAWRRHDDEIDLDLSMSAPDPRCKRHPAGEVCRGHIYPNHWPLPMVHDGFRDPLRRIKKTTPFRRLTAPQIARLFAISRRRLYRIPPIERVLRRCAKRGIGAVLEPKGDPRFEEDWPWEYLAKLGDELGVHLRAYALPHNSKALAPARRAGIPGRTIH